MKQPAAKQPKAHEGIAGIAARVGPQRAGAILRSSQVAMAFEALGDRWSALMLREIFLGARRFEELVAATGANRATLTSRLRSLVDEGILHRHPYQVRPTRYEYRLTRMGADLYPTALMYWLWDVATAAVSRKFRASWCTGRAARRRHRCSSAAAAASRSTSAAFASRWLRIPTTDR
jgi:DNA-binding HxlR family transcriptional regulator